MAKLKEELQKANAEVVEARRQNNVLKEKLHNGRQVMPNHVLSSRSCR